MDVCVRVRVRARVCVCVCLSVHAFVCVYPLAPPHSIPLLMRREISSLGCFFSIQKQLIPPDVAGWGLVVFRSAPSCLLCVGDAAECMCVHMYTSMCKCVLCGCVRSYLYVCVCVCVCVRARECHLLPG